ncbi:MAG: hypothetical protein CHACPFDD_00187 [Phycisphaerae bacterium]|nr:hypothetical protein [Phycisphaerae bacterium]
MRRSLSTPMPSSMGFAAARCLCAAAVVLSSATVHAQCVPDWFHAASGGPSVRSYAGLAYDGSDQLTILYGGANGNTLRSDVWTWDGVAWMQRSVSGGAGARRAMAMAYHAASDRTVVFGGVTAGGINGETWLWGGTSWSQTAIGETAPAPRGFDAMVGDTGNGVCVLFGGWSGGFTYWGDTWVWDGTVWTDVTPGTSPPARAFHALAYDSRRSRVVLFGGLRISGSTTTYYADTWEWNGASWTDVTPPTSPDPRGYHALAYDAYRGRVVLFGGFSFDHGSFNDTWEWDGAAWTQQFPAAAPSLRQNHAIAYDAARRRSVLFGGQLNNTTYNDTWTLGGDSPCDANCDGSVNGFDVDEFVAALSGSGSGCSPCQGDVNGDGSVNGFDIDGFLGCLGAP